MLTDFIEKAITIGANFLEIEYKDREELITAFRGQFGIGIGSVKSHQSSELLEELKKLKKNKKATLSGQTYRLSFSERESFGELVYRIHWIKD